MFRFLVALFELWIPANDGANPGYFHSREEMYVRVRKGGFMVETLRHSNVNPNVLFETLEPYIYIYIY